MPVLYNPFSIIQILYDPRSHYRNLSVLVKRHRIYAAAMVYLGAWMGASMITFAALVILPLYRAVTGYFTLWDMVLAFPRAMFYSFMFPLVVAGIDAALITAGLALTRHDGPLYMVPAVRASSLLPYSIRVIYAGYMGRLSWSTLVAAHLSPIDGPMLLAGYMLTVYGLREAMGVNPRDGLGAAAPPFAYKLILGLALSG